MKATHYLAIIVVIFFAVALYAIHLEENRSGDRRQQDHPVAEERRVQDRRTKGFFAYLLWAVRTLAAKLVR